jgi:predicted RNase H-like nuclease
MPAHKEGRSIDLGWAKKVAAIRAVRERVVRAIPAKPMSFRFYFNAPTSAFTCCSYIDRNLVEICTGDNFLVNVLSHVMQNERDHGLNCRHMEAIFSGFDSAWGPINRGAICNLNLQEDGSLLLTSLNPATWDSAIEEAGRPSSADLHVWVIDQATCVRNGWGCRPVERDLGMAIGKSFGFVPHSSNRLSKCWTPGAGIWNFLKVLQSKGYVEEPMSVPGATSGRFIFESYPHPAMLGLFDLDTILGYKVHKKEPAEWTRTVRLIQSLASVEMPITNVASFVTADLAQSKSAEDMIDSLICAYTGAFWWRFGTERSTMIGDPATGRMVLPHSRRTLEAFVGVWGDRMNGNESAEPKPELVKAPINRPAPGPRKVAPTARIKQPAAASKPKADAVRARKPEVAPVSTEPVSPGEWIGPVEAIVARDSVLWREPGKKSSNAWMDADRTSGWKLQIRLLGEPGQPVISFEPFVRSGVLLDAMKPTPYQPNQHRWRVLVSGSTRNNPTKFKVMYRYDPLIDRNAT